MITTRWVTTLRADAADHHRARPAPAVVDATLASLQPDIGYRLDHHEDLDASRRWWRSTSTATAPGGRRAACGSSPRPPTTVPSPPRSASASSTTARRSCWPATPCPAPASTRCAAGAGALVHTVIRKDLLEPIGLPRLTTSATTTPRSRRPRPPPTRAGVGTLVLTHYVPGHRPGPGGRVAGPRRHGVRRPRSSSATTCTGSRSHRPRLRPRPDWGRAGAGCLRSPAHGPTYPRRRHSPQVYRLRRAIAATRAVVVVALLWQGRRAGRGEEAAPTTTSSSTTTTLPALPAVHATGDVISGQDPSRSGPRSSSTPSGRSRPATGPRTSTTSPTPASPSPRAWPCGAS